MTACIPARSTDFKVEILNFYSQKCVKRILSQEGYIK